MRECEIFFLIPLLARFSTRVDQPVGNCLWPSREIYCHILKSNTLKPNCMYICVEYFKTSQLQCPSIGKEHCLFTNNFTCNASIYHVWLTMQQKRQIMIIKRSQNT